MAFLSPAARAQGLFYLFEPSPQRIERQLEAAGYELRGPLLRRGDVYVGDVVANSGVRERLVIDARTARILERFPTRADRWRDDRFGDWRERDAEAPWDAPPRPPRGLAEAPDDEGVTREDGDVPPAIRPKPHDDIVRADPAGKPTVIYGDDGTNGPPTATVDGDKPAKAKPHAAKKKPAVARANPPAEGATPSGSSPATAPAANPPGEVQRPNVPPPRMQAEAPDPGVRPEAEAKPAAEEKPATGVSTDAKPSAEAKAPVEEKPVAEAKTAAPPAGPQPEKKPKAVNDVPVNPLD